MCLCGHHAVVQDSILQRCVAGVLAVEVLADHLNMSLLSHLLCWFHAKTDVTSDKTRETDINRLLHAWANSYTHAYTSDRHLTGIFVRKVLLKHVYPECNPQTYIFLATSVSLNCSFTMTAARPRTQRVNSVKSILIWRFLHTVQCLMKVSPDPSATCSTALTSVRVHASLMKTERVTASHPRSATPADGERSKKYKQLAKSC